MWGLQESGKSPGKFLEMHFAVFPQRDSLQYQFYFISSPGPVRNAPSPKKHTALEHKSDRIFEFFFNLLSSHSLLCHIKIPEIEIYTILDNPTSNSRYSLLSHCFFLTQKLRSR